MNKLILICTVLVCILMLTGCLNNKNQSHDSNTWGDRNQIRIEDIHEIEVKDRNDTDKTKTLTQQEMNRFINALSNGRHDNAALDIRPSDYSVDIHFNNGTTKELSLWLHDGGNLFTDQSTSGHYNLNESDKTEIKEILENH